MRELDWTLTPNRENKYQYNGGVEKNTDFDLNWYETDFRRYDPQIGRLTGVDALADLFPAMSPYVYAYNNPINFNDPTGLNGECTDCERLAEENACRASRLGEGGGTGGLSNEDLINSGNPIYRNIGLQQQRGNTNYVSNSLSGQRNISAGGVAPHSQWKQDFNNAFGMALNYGLGGTLLAIYGAPMVVDMMMADGGMDIASIMVDAYTGDYVSAGIDVVALALPGVNSAEIKTFFHYTNEVGLGAILRSEKLLPSLKDKIPFLPVEGVYVSDLVPGQKTLVDLSNIFYRNPKQGDRLTHYIEIDVNGLGVQFMRDNVYVIPTQNPLPINGRIVGHGKTPQPPQP